MAGRRIPWLCRLGRHKWNIGAYEYATHKGAPVTVVTAVQQYCLRCDTNRKVVL